MGPPTTDTVKTVEERFPLSKHGRQLWTRELGRTIRQEAERALERMREGGVLVIDAKQVEVFDYSFANELFGRLLLRLSTEHAGRFVIVENLTDYARENLVKALESLGLLIIERRGGKLHLLGKVHPSDEETFHAILRERGPATASGLKDHLRVNLTAMNERLTKLLNLGVVRREKVTSPAGREQYQYRVLA